jgi:hypothetical protein
MEKREIIKYLLKDLENMKFFFDKNSTNCGKNVQSDGGKHESINQSKITGGKVGL